MSEWCELPLTIDSTTIDSGLYMANIIVQDLNCMNVVSWQSWTAVNGDGLMEIKNSEIVIYNRYYAYKQFSNFIKPGMVRVDVLDSFEEESKIASTAFTNGDETVIVLINNSENEAEIRLSGYYGEMKKVLTDSVHNCEEIYSGEFEKKNTLPAKSITTMVLK
jgi:O-glycosyl hydrolase